MKSKIGQSATDTYSDSSEFDICELDNLLDEMIIKLMRDIPGETG